LYKVNPPKEDGLSGLFKKKNDEVSEIVL